MGQPTWGEAVLQSSTEEWGLQLALNRAAVHWCWVIAHLCEEPISIGISAVKITMSSR